MGHLRRQTWTKKLLFYVLMDAIHFGDGPDNMCSIQVPSVLTQGI